MEKYEILYGNRRFAAHKKLGMNTIRANVKGEGEKTINLDEIKTRKNIRTNVDKDDLGSLMRSIRDQGLLQAIGVAETGTVDDKEFTIINTVENVLRKEISPIELGKCCTELKEQHNMSTSEIAARLNLNQNKIDIAINIWRKLPKEFHEDIGYVEVRTDKKGILTPTIVSSILGLKLSAEETKRLLHFVRKENLAIRHLRLFRNLKSQGYTLTECFKEYKTFLNMSFDMAFNREVFFEMMKENNLKTRGHLVSGILKGDIRPRSGLIA